MTTRPDDVPPVAGPYIQTVSGRWVNPFEPDPAQLDASDIARALANQCRFGGHSRVFYSVAQHSVIVSRVVEERGGDVEDVREAEAGLEATIRERFKIKANVPEVKRVDRALLATERRTFSAESWHWPELDDVEPLDLELTAWPPDKAADEFARRYAELEARR